MAGWQPATGWGRCGKQWLSFVLALGCGRLGLQNTDQAPDAGGGGAGGGDTAGAGGTAAALRCQIPLAERCDRFETGSSRILLLRPDEYQNSISTLFGVTVHVETLLLGPFDRSTVEPLPPGFMVPAYREAARLVAEQVSNQALALLPCEDQACVTKFVAALAPQVWRSPVSAAEQGALVSVFQTAPGTAREKFRALLEALLSSGRFYFRTELGDASGKWPLPLTNTELAAKLSYLFWADTPDQALLQVASEGRLTRASVLVEQARRLLQDPRASRGLGNFYRTWLGLDPLDSIAKDPALFPVWNRALAADMKRETIAFVDSVVVQGDAKVETLFGADYSFVSPALATLYGIAPPGPAFSRVALPPERRGLLTQASLLALTSPANRTSAAARALMVRQDLRCEFVPQIDDGHFPLWGKPVDDTLPARQRAPGLAEPRCKACHQVLEPLGFGFENFDAIGRYRTQDGGQNIDSTGQLLTSADEVSFQFHDVPELGQHLAQDPAVFACFAQQALAWSGSPASTCSAAQAVLQTCQAGDLRETLAALTGTEAFRFVGPSPEVSMPADSCDVRGLGDCAYLSKHAGVSFEACQACQGAPCGTPGCEPFACQGVIVIRGCCSDQDCQGLTRFCGLHASPRHLCVKDDPI